MVCTLKVINLDQSIIMKFCGRSLLSSSIEMFYDIPDFTRV